MHELLQGKFEPDGALCLKVDPGHPRYVSVTRFVAQAKHHHDADSPCGRFEPDGTVLVSIPSSLPAYADLAALIAEGRHCKASEQRNREEVFLSGMAMPEDAHKELAQHYARLWNALQEQGEQIPPHEMHTAKEELAGGAWQLVHEDGRWQVRPHQEEANEPETVEMSAVRAPKGYTRQHPLVIAGKAFIGGMWIPQEYLNTLPPEQRQQLEQQNSQMTAASREKRAAIGEVNIPQLQQQLLPHAQQVASTHAEDKRMGPFLAQQHAKSAEKMYQALVRHHGNLTVHRLKELSDQYHRALQHTPADEPGQAASHQAELAKIHHALRLAQAAGHTGAAVNLTQEEQANAAARRAEQEVESQKKAARPKKEAVFPVEGQANPWQGGEIAPGQVYNAPTSALAVDPGRFQFKQKVNKEGVTEELKGVTEWNPDFAGVLSVWRDPHDGKTYVVNGHHRAELARRLGVGNVAIRYLDAPDAKMARAKGALINMAEGRGTAVDASKFMRDAGVGPDELKKQGVSLQGTVARDALLLNDLSDQAFDAVARGAVDPTVAMSVAAHLKNHDRQNLLFGKLKKMAAEDRLPRPSRIEEMARAMELTAEGDKGGGSLFETGDEPLFEERAEVSAHVRGELAREVNDFMAVSSKRRAGRVSEAGNVLDVEQNRKIAQEAERVKNVFDKLANRKGPISEALNQAAVAYGGARTKKERENAKKSAVEAVRNAVFAEAGVGQAHPQGETRTTPVGGEGTTANPPAGPAQATAAVPGGTEAGAAGIKPEPMDRSPGIGEESYPAGMPDPDSVIESMPGLTPDKRAIEKKAKISAIKNKDKFIDQYLDNPDNASKDASGKVYSVVFNTDEWREFFAHDGYNGVNADAVHEPSSWMNKQIMNRFLPKDPAKPETMTNGPSPLHGVGNGNLVIYAGGGGSGKGSSIKDFFDERQYPIRIDQVTDSYKKALALFKRAEANGFKPAYIFVDRPPEHAWTGGVVRRALNLRKQGKLARTVPLNLAMKANIEARKTALEMVRNNPEFNPSVVDNTKIDSDPDGKPRLITNREEMIKHLEDGIRRDEEAAKGGLEERLRKELLAKHHAGEIPRDIAEGLLGKHAGLLDQPHVESAVGNESQPQGVNRGEVPAASAAGPVPGSAAVPGNNAGGAELPAAAPAGQQLLRPATAEAGGRAPAGPGTAEVPQGTPGEAGPASQPAAGAGQPPVAGAGAQAIQNLHALTQDTPRADDAYNQLPDASGGKIINADTARELSPEFRDNYADRVRMSPGMVAAAGGYAYDRMRRELANPKGRKNFMILAGGPAAGKSSSLKPEDLQKADLVWDTTLRDHAKADETIADAIKHGWNVNLRYVHADPETFTHGMLDRTQRTGRWDKFAGVAPTHQQAQQNTLAALQKYGNQIHADLFHRGPDNKTMRIRPQDIAEGGRHHLGDDAGQKAQAAFEKLAPGYDPRVVSLMKGEADPEKLAADFEKNPPGKPGEQPGTAGSQDAGEQHYLDQAMGNLKKTSRTAGGVVDTSASKEKADKVVEGLTGAQAAEHATRNFEGAIKDVYRASKSLGQQSPEAITGFVDNLSKKINQGITKEGVLLRTDDSPKFPYTAVKNLPLARQQFAEELKQRLNDPNADPVETAAWIEWRVNLTDHGYADGVGKLSKAMAAIPLMKAGLPLPNYPDNKVFFQHASRSQYDPRNGGQSYLDDSWKHFLGFYRTLMPGAGKSAQPEPVSTPDARPMPAAAQMTRKPTPPVTTADLQDAYDADRRGTKKMPVASDFASYPASPEQQAAVESAVRGLTPDKYSAADLAKVYGQASKEAPMTPEQFRGTLAKLHHEGRVQLEPHTRAMSEIAQPETAVPLAGEIMGSARPGQVQGPSVPEEPAKPAQVEPVSAEPNPAIEQHRQTLAALHHAAGSADFPWADLKSTLAAVKKDVPAKDMGTLAKALGVRFPKGTTKKGLMERIEKTIGEKHATWERNQFRQGEPAAE